jgi:hypothetical protein
MATWLLIVLYALGYLAIGAIIAIIDLFYLMKNHRLELALKHNDPNYVLTPEDVNVWLFNTDSLYGMFICIALFWPLALPILLIASACETVISKAIKYANADIHDPNAHISNSSISRVRLSGEEDERLSIGSK